MASDEDIVPKRSPQRSARGVSPGMRRLMRLTRVLGVLLGGIVTLVFVMSVVGLAIDNFWVRLLVGLIVVVAVPAVIAERLLRRTNLSGVSFVANVFAVVLLSLALIIASFGAVTRPLLVREGDRHARAGSRTFARAVYFIAGVTPTFPEPASTTTAKPASSASDAGTGQ